MIRAFDPQTPFADHDLCVVGSGPVGLAIALRVAEAGMGVLVLERGDGDDPWPDDKIDLKRHAAMDVAAARVFGGTSQYWGGRCVPFDPIDFAVRPWMAGPGWPLAIEDLDPWLAPAAEFLGCGKPLFSAPAPGGERLDPAAFDALERWTPRPVLAKRYRAAVAASDKIELVVEATATHVELTPDGDRVSLLRVQGPAGMAELHPRRLVLAGGGVETTRLLLASQRTQPRAFGGSDGPLGRFYMGHLSGKIADILLADPDTVDRHDFFLDGEAYARRRLTLSPEAQAAHGLANVSFWADNPRFHDARHGIPLLSLVWLALATPVVGSRLASEGVRRSHLGPSPRRLLPHLRNVLKRPHAVAAQLARLLHDRYLAKPPKPGFLLRNAAGRYALHYHSEQAPSAESRIRLRHGRSAGDLPPLDIDLRFSKADIASVISAHQVLDEALQRSGMGRLEFHQPPEARPAAVDAQATDGFHQIGSTRMAARREDGVVDPDLRVHDVANLYVASSSVFPTSGQANPTLLAVMLGLRLVDHLAAESAR